MTSLLAPPEPLRERRAPTPDEIEALWQEIVAEVRRLLAEVDREERAVSPGTLE